MLQKGFISFLFLLLTAAPAFAEVVIIVRREAQPTGNYVRVCDIARVDGPADLAREVAMTVLGPAPVGGETQEISRWDIETRLFEMGVGARVTFTGNDVVRVFGNGMAARHYAEPAFQPLDPSPERAAGDGAFAAGQPVTRLEQRQSERQAGAKPAPALPMRAEPGQPERRSGRLDELGEESRARVAQAIGDYFADRYRADNAKRTDIEVAASVVGAAGGIPSTAYDLRVEGAEGKIPGRAKVRLLVRDEADSGEREVVVAADTEVSGLALVPVRNFSGGETINPSDVRVERVRMEWGQNYLPPNAKAVLGREAARALKPGEALRPEDAVPGEAVKRGQLVIVDTSGRGWQVVTKAKAQGSGAVGDIITVEDTQNKTKYPARITGHGTVSVVVNKNRLIYGRD
jgi:flagella basal body P-ring formation protein FlgA